MFILKLSVSTTALLKLKLCRELAILKPLLTLRNVNIICFYYTCDVILF